MGVRRQYSGTAGRVENCQGGVFLAYATPHGRAFLDREPYLPKEWAADADRREEAGVPGEVAFRTKPELARALLARAFATGVPAGWVTGDEVYGRDWRLRRWRRTSRAGPRPTAGRSTSARPRSPRRGPEAWAWLSAGDGSKGPRVYNWARARLARLDAPGRAHWLLARRSLDDPADLADYVASAPADTALATLVRVAGARWAVEEGFEIVRGEVGLDHDEVRRWAGWSWQITLALFAQAFLTAVRARAAGAEKGGVPPRRPPS